VFVRSSDEDLHNRADTRSHIVEPGPEVVPNSISFFDCAESVDVQYDVGDSIVVEEFFEHDGLEEVRMNKKKLARRLIYNFI
jgi:hypothetical protein